LLCYLRRLLYQLLRHTLCPDLPPKDLELTILIRMQALARVVYARCEIVVLDDSLSALDGNTENRIVENLLGPEGLFKKMGTTIFLITNASKSKTPLPKGKRTNYSIQLRISSWQTG
jgi:hypothetical protein